MPIGWTGPQSVWESETASREACVCTDVFLVGLHELGRLSRDEAECGAGRDVVRCGSCQDVTCQTLATPAHLCHRLER